MERPGGELGLVPVTAGDAGTLDPQLAGFALRDVYARVVNDPGLDREQGQAAGSGLLDQPLDIEHRHGEVGTGLAHSEAIGKANSGARESFDLGLGIGRTAGDVHLEAVELLRRKVRVLPQRGRHLRDREIVRDPQRRIGDPGDGFRRIEPGADPHCPASQNRHAHGRKQPGGVEHRHVAQEHAVIADE